MALRIPVRLDHSANCARCGAIITAGMPAVRDQASGQVFCPSCIPQPSSRPASLSLRPGGESLTQTETWLGWEVVNTIRDSTVQLASGVAAAALAAAYLLRPSSDVDHLVELVLVAVLLAAILVGTWGRSSTIWRVYRSAVATALVWAFQLVLAVSTWLFPARVASPAQIRSQAHLISRCGSGRVVWHSEARAARNIKELTARCDPAPW